MQNIEDAPVYSASDLVGFPNQPSSSLSDSLAGADPMLHTP
jgi:hypothetical protein